MEETISRGEHINGYQTPTGQLLKHGCQEHYRDGAGSICPFMNMCTETYMYVKVINGKEGMKLNKYGRLYSEFGGRNRGSGGEMMLLYHNHINKRSILNMHK